MRHVQLEDNELLSSLANDAQSGEPIALVRDGRLIAQIVGTSGNQKPRAERLLALRELDALMERGYDMGVIWNGRDELYDRDDD